ncbi:hypothetical protein CCH79_00012952, partial [Gambusia affinis]
QVSAQKSIFSKMLPPPCFIEEMESQVNVEVAIPQRHHRAIMGPKGSRIQNITREHEVQIKFPERDDSAAGQDASPQENGDVSPEAEFVPRKCDIITISGRAEKCELARAALLVSTASAQLDCLTPALVPITEDVEVSYDLHRYIIGQKGSGIRKLMEEYEVNIWVPQPEKQLDVIKVTGLAANVERAKLGLLERVKELQAEQEDRALRSFKVTVSVDPKFHPKIIGRKGAVISQIRKDHDVSIQFPDKGDDQQLSPPFSQDLIVICGYERNVEEARQAIQQLVSELQEMVSQDIHLDPRTHARIIGARGKAIRKLMEEFKVRADDEARAGGGSVDIRFPQPGSDEPDKVTVTGLPDTVDAAIDHLLNLEEDYLLSVTETETLAAYMKPPSRHGGGGGAGGLDDSSGGPAKGFVVRDAPWNAAGNKSLSRALKEPNWTPDVQTSEAVAAVETNAPDMSSAEDFPTFGTSVAPKQTSAWGPKKF